VPAGDFADADGDAAADGDADADDFADADGDTDTERFGTPSLLAAKRASCLRYSRVTLSERKWTSFVMSKGKSGFVSSSTNLSSRVTLREKSQNIE
jgi:hypothetical protein